jgi:hypothetical protein
LPQLAGRGKAPEGEGRSPTVRSIFHRKPLGILSLIGDLCAIVHFIAMDISHINGYRLFDKAHAEFLRQNFSLTEWESQHLL